ncbi:hypothetical protein V5P93_004918 [Actinokineospora auranticolor]|uniref:Polyketide cyclase/dehydrase/lipid transport protein n=1 Tax=Actinokineospora auranticolor TaxID=155976 RepID=A0A2S6GNS7_9PSEU|nr:hypothetical protein [Actinokineospora auranticolor]PPK66879.1 hypothetical protein CLV40_109264 [Actinokineospora auranticolor]
MEIGNRRRDQPPPPWVVFEALVERSPRWLRLLADERVPDVVEAVSPSLVVWSSLWVRRADAVVRFELAPRGMGTALRWILTVDEPAPDASLVGHLRRRVNELINADLRYSFGQ